MPTVLELLGEGAPAAPAVDDTVGDTSGGLRRGLRSAGAGFNRIAGTAAEAAGFNDFAARRVAAAQAADAANAADPAKVSSYKDVVSAPDIGTGLRRAVDYGTNMIGESLPALGAMAVGGLVGGTRGAALAMTPFSMGDVAARQEADPVASQESAGMRLGKQAIYGGVDAALNTIVPASIVGRTFGKAATAAAQAPVSHILGRVGVDAVAQGAAGAAGEAIKQVGVNPTKTLDVDQIGEVAVGGTALGAAMGGVGAAGTLARKAAGAPGRAVGAAVDAVGASGPVKALKDAVGPEGYDLGGKASAAMGAVRDKASALMPGADGGIDLGALKERAGGALTEAQKRAAALMPGADGGIDLGGIAKGLQDSLSSAKKSGRAFLDRVAAGDANATVDEAAYVGKTPEEVRAMQPEQDRTRVAKLREIGAGLMAQAGDLSEQARTQLAQAMNNIEDPRAQAVVARVKKGADAVAEWSADVASSAKLFGAGVVSSVKGKKKSEDYSGLHKQVMEPVLAVLREARPELFETGEWRTEKGRATLNEVASVVRLALDHVSREGASPLPSDKLFALINVFGDRAADVISSSYEAVHGNADKAGTAELFKTLKALDDLADQNKSLTETLRSLQDDSRDGPLSEYQLKQHTQWLRAYAGRSARAEVAGKGGVQMTLEKAQADYHDARIQRMLDSFYGKNKDKALEAAEADRRAVESYRNQFDDGFDQTYDAMHSEGADGKPDRQLSDEVLSEDADPTVRKAVAQTPDPVYRGEGGKDEVMLLAPEKAAGKGEFASATQQAMDKMTRDYPDRNVVFLRADEIGDHPAKTATLNKLIARSFEEHPDMTEADRLKLANRQLKDHGFVVAEGSRQETAMNDRDLKGMKLKRPEGSSADYKHPSRIDVGGEVLDAIKLAKWAEARSKDAQDYSNADNKSALHRAGRMFMEGLAAAQARIGKSLKEVPDSTQIGWHADGKTPLTWGEVKGLDYSPEKSKAVKDLEAKLDAMREEYKAGDKFERARILKDVKGLIDDSRDRELAGRDGTEKSYDNRYDAEGRLTDEGARILMQGDVDGGIELGEKARRKQELDDGSKDETTLYSSEAITSAYLKDRGRSRAQREANKEPGDGRRQVDPFGPTHDVMRGRDDITGAEIRTNLTGNSRDADAHQSKPALDPNKPAEGSLKAKMSPETKQLLIDKVEAMQRNYTTAAGQAVAKRALALMDRIDSLPAPAHRALVSLLAKGTKMSDVAEVVNRLMPEKAEPKPVERRTPEAADKAKRDATLDKMLEKEDYSALTTPGKTNAFLKRAYERYGEVMAMGDAKWEHPAFHTLSSMFDPGNNRMDLASLYEDFDGTMGGGMTDVEIRAKLQAAAPEVAAKLPKAAADRQAAVRAGPAAEAALDQANYSSMTKKFSKMGTTADSPGQPKGRTEQAADGLVGVMRGMGFRYADDPRFVDVASKLLADPRASEAEFIKGSAEALSHLVMQGERGKAIREALQGEEWLPVRARIAADLMSRGMKRGDALVDSYRVLAERALRRELGARHAGVVGKIVAAVREIITAIRGAAASDRFARVVRDQLNATIEASVGAQQLRDGMKRVTFQEAVDGDVQAADVLAHLAKHDDVSLTGSIVLAASGPIYRNAKNMLHDLDIIVRGSPAVVEAHLRKQFPGAVKVYDFKTSNGKVDTFIVPPKGAEVTNLKRVGQKVSSFAIERDGVEIGRTWNESGVEMKEGTTGTLVDLFSGTDDQAVRSIQFRHGGKDHTVRAVDAGSIFDAKLSMGRDKDLGDYLGFVPDVGKKFSKMGLQIHTELGRDGFAATHDSPTRHEGNFDWRAHAGKGEGNASFGAGTYLSTSEGTHRSYKGQFTAKVPSETSRHPAVKAAREALDNASDDVVFLMQERDERGPWRAVVGRAEHFASKAEAQAALDRWTAERRAKIADYAAKLREMDSPGGPKYNRSAILDNIAYLEGKLRDDAGNKPVYLQDEIDAATERGREAQAHYDEVKAKYAGAGYRGDKSPTYEVSVSIGEDSLLDWNKPLSGQHPKVQEKLRAAGIDIAPRNDWLGFVLDPNGVDEYMQHADELSRLADTASPELADRVFEAATTAFGRRTEMRGPDYSDRWGETKDLKHFPAELIEELRAVKSDGAAKAMEAFNEALDWRDAGKDLGAAYRAQEASASTGGQAYQLLQKKLGSQRAASEALQAAGILGNVHDAQFGNEKQFRNYVIYDDSKITTNYVHFDKTNSNHNAPPRAATADAALNAYIDKVLGPSIARDLNANIPHAGEFVKAGTQHLINISRFAMDPWGTGHHEALHSFFASMREASPTGEVARVLERAASSAPVLNQLKKLLKDHPEALKQLSDPEEAAAYMYQFWAAKKLTVGTQTHTIFSRIAAAVRRVLGIWSNDERALHILDYFHRGDFAVDRGQPDVVAQKLLLEHRNVLVDQAAKLTKPLRELSSSVAVAGGQQLRDSGIPALAQLADVIKLHGTSEGKDPGYMPAARAEHTRVMNDIMDKLAPFTAAQMREALDAMQQGVKAASKEARQIQLLVQNPKVGLLPKMREYMGNAGVDVSQFGPDPTYFHRVWDTGFIAAHEKEFMAMLGKYQISGDLKGDPRVILQNLMATDGLEFRVETNMPGMQALKMRKLGFITGADAEPFLRKDLLENLNSYVQQATRRAEWARRLGDQGEGLQDLLTKAAKQGATPEQLAAAQRYVKSIDGTLGDTIDPKYRRLFGNLMVYQNIRLLPLAIFSSLPDSLGIMVRGGTVAESGRAFMRGMMEIRKNFQKEGGKNDAATDLAELVGTIDSAQLMHAIGTSYSQGMVGNTGRRVNDLFFRYNFMDQYNRSMRVAATEAAINFIKRHADGSGKHSERWLAEIGLEPGKVKMDANGRPDVMDTDVRKAINRWVDGAVLRPDAADAPPWMADPRAALISHLKKFTFSFQETILKRVAHEYRHGNYAPAMALTSYVPMMLAADMAKGIIQGGGEEPDWKAGWDAGDYLGHAVQRAGLFGVGQFALDAYKGGQRDGPLGALGSLGGPTVGQLVDGVETMTGTQRAGTFLLHSMPANALYSGMARDAARDDPRAD